MCDKRRVLQIRRRSNVVRPKTGSETAAQHRAMTERRGEADSRLQVIVLSLDINGVAHTIDTRYLNPAARKCCGIGRIEVRDRVVLLSKRSRDVVPEAQIECQPAIKPPVILDEFADLRAAVLGSHQRHIASSLIVIAGE